MDLQHINQKLQHLEAKRRHKASLIGGSSKNCFLPFLKKFMKVREEEDVRSLQSKMIIQLMCIVLLRIKYRMHSAAMNVLLYVGGLLHHMKSYEYNLRRLVYALIGRVSGKLRRSAANVSLIPRRRHLRSFTGVASCPLQYVT